MMVHTRWVLAVLNVAMALRITADVPRERHAASQLAGPGARTVQVRPSQKCDVGRAEGILSRISAVGGVPEQS